MPDEPMLASPADFSGMVTSVGGGELLFEDAALNIHRLTYSLGPYELPLVPGDALDLRYDWAGPWTCAAGVVIWRDGVVVFGGTTTWGLLAADIGVATERVSLCCAYFAMGALEGGRAGFPMGLRVGLGDTIVSSGQAAPVTIAGELFTFVAGRVFDMACTCEDVGTQPSYFVVRN